MINRKKLGRHPQSVERETFSTNLKSETKKQLSVMCAYTGRNANEIIEELVDIEFKRKKDNKELEI